MSLQSPFYDTPIVRDVELNHVAHAAATADEHLCAFRSPCRALLKGVSWVPLTAVTGANTDSTNINIQNRGTDGNGTDELANVDFEEGTNAADLTALAIYSPAAGSELQMSTGTVIAAQFEKVGLGLDLPGGSFVFSYEPN